MAKASQVCWVKLETTFHYLGMSIALHYLNNIKKLKWVPFMKQERIMQRKETDGLRVQESGY